MFGFPLGLYKLWPSAEVRRRLGKPNKKTSYFVWISTRLALTLQTNHYLKVMFGIGTQEILIIALIILLLFGGKKIPELMRGLGKGVKSFKEGMNDLEGKSDKQDAPEKQENDGVSKE